MARRALRWSSRMAWLASALVLAAPAGTVADEIQLRGGRRISGIVVERTDRTITIETGPGQVTLPLSVVEKIDDTRSALQVWQERSTALDSGDAAGWAALARWAEGQSLVTRARAAWQHVLTLDPANAEANAALGRVRLDGAWVEPEQAYRAQGLVPFEGRWVTPAEQQALLRQQEADSAAARSQREAEARAQEAEARAREAEARAQEAESAQPYDGGIPIYGGDAYGVGGYGCGGYPGCADDDHGRRRRRDDRGDGNDRGHDRGRPHTEPRPTPTPEPSSLGPSRPPNSTPDTHPGTAAPKHRGSAR